MKFSDNSSTCVNSFLFFFSRNCFWYFKLTLNSSRSKKWNARGRANAWKRNDQIQFAWKRTVRPISKTTCVRFFFLPSVSPWFNAVLKLNSNSIIQHIRSFEVLVFVFTRIRTRAWCPYTTYGAPNTRDFLWNPILLSCLKFKIHLCSFGLISWSHCKKSSHINMALNLFQMHVTKKKKKKKTIYSFHKNQE